MHSTSYCVTVTVKSHISHCLLQEEVSELVCDSCTMCSNINQVGINASTTRNATPKSVDVSVPKPETGNTMETIHMMEFESTIASKSSIASHIEIVTVSGIVLLLVIVSTAVTFLVIILVIRWRKQRFKRKINHCNENSCPNQR